MHSGYTVSSLLFDGGGAALERSDRAHRARDLCDSRSSCTLLDYNRMTWVLLHNVATVRVSHPTVRVDTHGVGHLPADCRVAVWSGPARELPKPGQLEDGLRPGEGMPEHPCSARERDKNPQEDGDCQRYNELSSTASIGTRT